MDIIHYIKYTLFNRHVFVIHVTLNINQIIQYIYILKTLAE